MSITNPTLDASNGTVSAWLSSNQDLNTYLSANSGAVTVVNVAPSTYGDLDYINLTGGGLSLGTRSSATFGSGSLVIQDNGWLSGAAAGDLFNLFDWVSAMTGSFAMPGTGSTGGDLGVLFFADPVEFLIAIVQHACAVAEQFVACIAGHFT